MLAHYDARALIAFGFVVQAVSMFWMAHYFDLTIDFKTLAWARIFQSAGLAFLFIPINTAAYAYLPREKNNAASGLINLARNVGGSVGISFVTTELTRRAQYHQSVLTTHTTLLNPGFRGAVASASHVFMSAGNVSAQRQAYGEIYGLIMRQAGMLAYIDNFWILAVISLVVVPLVFLMKRPPKGTVVAAH